MIEAETRKIYHNNYRQIYKMTNQDDPPSPKPTRASDLHLMKNCNKSYTYINNWMMSHWTIISVTFAHHTCRSNNWWTMTIAIVDLMKIHHQTVLWCWWMTPQIRLRRTVYTTMSHSGFRGNRISNSSPSFCTKKIKGPGSQGLIPMREAQSPMNSKTMTNRLVTNLDRAIVGIWMISKGCPWIQS